MAPEYDPTPRDKAIFGSRELCSPGTYNAARFNCLDEPSSMLISHPDYDPTLCSPLKLEYESPKGPKTLPGVLSKESKAVDSLLGNYSKMPKGKKTAQRVLRI
jgi:hypothetical protein